MRGGTRLGRECGVLINAWWCIWKVKTTPGAGPAWLLVQVEGDLLATLSFLQARIWATRMGTFDNEQNIDFKTTAAVIFLTKTAPWPRTESELFWSRLGHKYGVQKNKAMRTWTSALPS